MILFCHWNNTIFSLEKAGLNSFERCGARGPLFVFFVCKHSPPSRSDFLIYLPTLSSSAQSTPHKLDILICNASQQNQIWTRPPFAFTGLPSICAQYTTMLSADISHIFRLDCFFTRLLTGVESTSGNSVHLFVCPSVITSYSFPLFRL